MPKTIRLIPRTALDMVFWAMVIDYTVFGMILPIFPSLFFDEERSVFELTTSHDTRTLLFGLLAGSYAFSAFLGAPILGAWSDRVGRKRALLFAFSANLLSYILIAVSIIYNQVWLLFAARIIAGLFGSSLPVIQSALSDLSNEKSKVHNFGLPAVAFGIGIIIGPVLGGVLSNPDLVHWFRYTTPFFLIIGLSFLNLIFINHYFPDSVAVRNSKPIKWHSGFYNISAALRDKRLANIFLVIFSLTCGFYFFIQFYQVYLKQKFEVDETHLGLIFGFSGVLLALVQGLLLKPLSKKMEPQRILLFSLPLFAIGYLLMMIPQNYWLSFAFLPFMALFQGLSYPNTLVIVSNQADEKFQGEIIGINQSVSSLAMAIPPVVAAFAMTFTLDFPMLFGAGCTLIAWVIFVYGWRNKL